MNPTLEDPGFTTIAWGLRLGFPITQLVELPAERTPGMLNSLKQYEIAFFGTAAARLKMLLFFDWNPTAIGADNDLAMKYTDSVPMCLEAFGAACSQVLFEICM